MAISTRLIGDLVYLSVCGFTLWKGGRSERLVAAAMLLEIVVGHFIRAGEVLEDPRYISLALDSLVLVALLFVAFSTDHRWALLGSALQILSVLTYITRIIDPTIHSWAYITVSIGIGYGLLAILIYATCQTLLLKRRMGKSQA